MVLIDSSARDWQVSVHTNLGCFVLMFVYYLIYHLRSQHFLPQMIKQSHNYSVQNSAPSSFYDCCLVAQADGFRDSVCVVDIKRTSDTLTLQVFCPVVART